MKKRIFWISLVCIPVIIVFAAVILSTLKMTQDSPKKTSAISRALPIHKSNNESQSNQLLTVNNELVTNTLYPSNTQSDSDIIDNNATSGPPSLMEPIIYKVDQQFLARLQPEEAEAVISIFREYTNFYASWMMRSDRNLDEWNLKARSLELDLMRNIRPEDMDRLYR